MREIHRELLHNSPKGLVVTNGGEDKSTFILAKFRNWKCHYTQISDMFDLADCSGANGGNGQQFRYKVIKTTSACQNMMQTLQTQLGGCLD